jgi:hypothetical protein
MPATIENPCATAIRPSVHGNQSREVEAYVQRN